MYRSVTRSASLWKLPDRSNQVFGVKRDTSATSVSPSHLPTECPMNASPGYVTTSSRWIVRSAFLNSNAIMTFVVPWMIWNL